MVVVACIPGTWLLGLYLYVVLVRLHYNEACDPLSIANRSLKLCVGSTRSTCETQRRLVI
jgi:hypothetical protein